MFKYFDKIETKYKTVLASLSGAQMGSNHEKHIHYTGTKSREQHSVYLCVCIKVPNESSAPNIPFGHFYTGLPNRILVVWGHCADSAIYRY